jgi:hypothetical protein
MWPRISVWPSVELATSCIAMFPAAPGLLSTNTFWPMVLAISPATARATISELPPGAKGTTRRSGLVGQSAWARASQGEVASAAAPEVASHWRRVREEKASFMSDPGLHGEGVLGFIRA